MVEMKGDIRITDEYRPIVVRIKKAMEAMGLFEIREIEGFVTGEGDDVETEIRQVKRTTKVKKEAIPDEMQANPFAQEAPNKEKDQIKEAVADAQISPSPKKVSLEQKPLAKQRILDTSLEPVDLKLDSKRGKPP